MRRGDSIAANEPHCCMSSVVVSYCDVVDSVVADVLSLLWPLLMSKFVFVVLAAAAAAAAAVLLYCCLSFCL